jgi:hypothetical protein
MLKHVCFFAFFLLAVSCNRPNMSPTRSETPSVPFSSAASSASGGQPESLDLAALVKQITAAEHRSGAVIYGVACGPERTLAEKYMPPLSPKTQPNRAMEQLLHSYPRLKWEDSAAGIRVLDAGITAGLLKVRIREFAVVEDRDAETALAALSRTPEVIRYMATHDIRFARKDGKLSARRSRGVVVVHLKNATVEQIVQQIAAHYSDGASRFWSYRECRRGAETLVEIKIL